MAVAAASADDINDGNLPATQVNTGAVATTPQSAPAEGQIFTRRDDDDEVTGNLVADRFNKLSRTRQIQLLAGSAIGLALVIFVIVWSLKPGYKLLYGNLSEQASAEVVEALKAENIPYELDAKSGQIMVEPDRVQELRLMLASRGLPGAEGAGFEILEEKQGFGTSQFLEQARYNRALEGELARSVTALENVESARVHLAIPKQSVFVRDRREPSASVLVNLKQGRSLGEAQVSAIVHMVASSIPSMKSESVTVVDQTGKMLTKKQLQGDMALSSAQFEYKQKMENYYIERIERILAPVVGFEGVRAEVDADVDFALVEQTQESFNPDMPAVRSEQTREEESRGGDVGGVPGALTNQPPGVATAPETLPDEQGQGGASGPSRKSRQQTYNYELDKTISHTRKAPGSLKRLSVAVVVDDKTIFDEAGEPQRVALTPEALERITSLVKEAVGFSAQRGDSVNVTNVPFLDAVPLPPKPKGEFWEQAWFVEVAKQAVAVLAVMLLVMLVIRPVVRALTYKEPEEEVEEVVSEELEAEPEGAVKVGGMKDEEWDKLGVTAEEYEKMLETLRQMVTEDPRLVAQVVKTWVALDEPENHR